VCADRARGWGLIAPRRGWSAGGAALEFAVVAPVFLALVFGIIDFSRYAFSLISVRQAAAEAVRAASLGRTEAEVQQIARAQAPFLGDALTVHCTGCGGTDPAVARTYRITASAPFTFLLPYVPGGAITISETTEVTY
jgi:Flp pilus assembly protein TadG